VRERDSQSKHLLQLLLLYCLAYTKLHFKMNSLYIFNYELLLLFGVSNMNRMKIHIIIAS